MQAPTPSDRSFQRRSPMADPGPPPNVPPRAMSPQPGQVPRTSSSSAKSTANSSMSRRTNGSSSSQTTPNPPPLSQIEKSVTHLLVATKQLLETLTQWSRHQATDAQVSDVYVRLGYEFNIACRAFTAINVDVSDLGNVPELLRHILESTLSQEASVESLEKYLPRIRDIIISLLHGLKRKQQKLRLKQQRDAAPQTPPTEASVTRVGSASSVGSANTGLTTLLDQGMSNNMQSDIPAKEARNSNSSQPETNASLPPRMSSASNRRGLPAREDSRSSVASDQSSLSSTTMQNMPVLPPYPEEDPTPTAASAGFDVDAFPPPPPPPKQQNALAALQRGGDLERRASRRYSAYQIAKHIGASPNGVPMMPQNSPIPNRGRNDARESMRAVQNRSDQRLSRQQSTRVPKDASPARKPSRIVEEDSNKIVIPPPDDGPIVAASPIAKTPEDKLRQSQIIDFDAPSATLKGPPIDDFPIHTEAIPEPTKQVVPTAEPVQQAKSTEESASYQNDERRFTPEQSPLPGKELTLFLQYKTKIKKFVFADGFNELSVARLQLAFIEKFAWNTHNNGVDLPEIYIQDPVSGVRHELEDLNDIKDRSVLVLNVEVLDEVKRHIDEGFVGIKKIIEGVRTVVNDQQASIQRVSDRQQDTAKEITRLASTPPLPLPATNVVRSGSSFSSPTKVASQQVSEIQSLRRDLAVLRQTYSSFQSDIQNSMTTIRAKANSVKTTAVKAALPDLNGDSGRAYVNAGKKTLATDSDKLVGHVDDLQDIVEDLRKDVVNRGVRPLPRQLETVAKDISQATFELKKMQEYLKREKPVWTKIWEKELETVCNDREEMTMQEDLAADLEDDLEKAQQTFALVEMATKEQLKDNPGSAGRVMSRGLNHVPAADPSAAKEGVLGEVRALQPNHENRLEAIERAEKLRQKELESRRGGEFQKELGNFVEEGKLKKSGGFEEVERARKAKDDRIRREVWERQNGMIFPDAAADGADAEGEDISPAVDAESEDSTPEAPVPAS